MTVPGKAGSHHIDFLKEVDPSLILFTSDLCHTLGKGFTAIYSNDQLAIN